MYQFLIVNDWLKSSSHGSTHIGGTKFRIIRILNNVTVFRKANSFHNAAGTQNKLLMLTFWKQSSRKKKVLRVLTNSNALMHPKTNLIVMKLVINQLQEDPEENHHQKG